MASKRRMRRMCRKKTAYPDLSAAVRALKGLGAAGSGLHPYECPMCRRWHLGHRPARMVADMMAKGSLP